MNTSRFLTTLIGMALACAIVQAQELTGTLKKVKESGLITIGFRESSIPFSYLDDKQNPIGYSMDLCSRIVDAVKSELRMRELKVVLLPVTSATRIPLMANGTIDLECGSTTNNVERQGQVSFVLTTFVTSNRLLSKKATQITRLDDLKGKSVVSTAGTSNLKQITELNASRGLGLNILTAKDHAEGFLMVKTNRAAAFAMDDILLYSLVANDPRPTEYFISKETLSVEPYGIMLRKGDAAFKKVADQAVMNVFRNGDIDKLYAKWFLSPIPPKNITLYVPMSDGLKKVIRQPTDAGDSAAYL